MTASGPTTNIGSPRSPEALRLFVALWPSTKTRARIESMQRGTSWPHGVRIVPPDDLHITLSFLGAVPADGMRRVRQAVAVPSADIMLSLDQVEVWKGGIVVLTPRSVPHALVALHGRLTESLRASGLPFDESCPTFTPHVTLARRAGGVPPAELQPIAWRSSGHVLAQSAGGRYGILDRL